MQDRKKKEFLISLEHSVRHEAECQLCGAFTTMCSVTGRPTQKHPSLSCQRRYCGIRQTEPTRHSPLSLVHSTHAAPWRKRQRAFLHSSYVPLPLPSFCCLFGAPTPSWCREARQKMPERVWYVTCSDWPSAPDEDTELLQWCDTWCVLKEWHLLGLGVSQAWEAPVDMRTPPKKPHHSKDCNLFQGKVG